MTSPVVVPGPTLYGRWRYRPDGVTMYCVDRPDWNGGVTPPPPPPPPGGSTAVRVKAARAVGKSVDLTPPGGGGETFVVGVTRPTRANTGCSDYTVLTEWTGSYTFGQVGTAASPVIIQDKWFTDKVSITGKYIHFVNCYFAGGWQVANPLIQCTNVNCFGNELIRCTLWQQNPIWDNPAVKGWQIFLRRCYIRGCTDGIAHIGYGWATRVVGGVTERYLAATGDYTDVDQNIYAEGCLVEKMCYVSPDKGAAGKLPDNASHLDVMCQTRGGNNFGFKGNEIRAYIDPTIGEGGLPSVDMISTTHVTGKRTKHTGLYSLSAFMFSPILGTLKNWVAADNWMDGADQMFVLAEHLAGVSITGTRFGRDHRTAPGLILAKTSAVMTVSGNHYMYELGPSGEKWPYNQQPLAEAGETMPSAAKIAQWAAAGITTAENTWPAANIRSPG